MQDLWVIMSNDYPDCIVEGSETFADATAKSRKAEYVRRNCGYGPDAIGSHVDAARRSLADRIHFRASAVPVIREGAAK